MPSLTTQNATPRTTEGPRDSGAVAKGKGPQTARGRGRPAGSANKPKGLVPKNVAEGLLAAMSSQLPAEHFAYVKGVVKDGKALSTKTELQTLILLLSRNLGSALIDEMRPPEAPDNIEDALAMVESTGEVAPKQVFRRDVTERLKVLQSLLSLLNQIERRDEENKTDGDSPIMKIWAARGMTARVQVLVTETPQLPAGNVIEGEAQEV